MVVIDMNEGDLVVAWRKAFKGDVLVSSINIAIKLGESRVVFDAVVVVHRPDLTVRGQGEPFKLLRQKDAVERGNNVEDKGLGYSRTWGFLGKIDLVDALDNTIWSGHVVSLQDKENTVADRSNIRKTNPASVLRLNGIQRVKVELRENGAFG